MSELQALANSHSGQLTLLPLDLASDSSITQLGEVLRARNIRLDVLINNAGVSVPEAFGAWTGSCLERNFRINATGPALLAQALVERMNRGAKLVNVSSGMGALAWNIAPEGPLDAYAMSKAALNLFTRRLAEKLRSAGIMVVSINPGWVKTTMGGPDAPTRIEDAVEQITRLIRDLRLEQSGSFLSTGGDPIAW